ncbi:MAG TPA: response regulator [Candidatus Latescibacteria bacterium]|nr:response regulator [Candidatus Latescibacterota bacterium]
MGYVAVEAENGVEVMEKVSVRPLGGIEVLRQLHEQTHNIPVILVTAYSDLDSVQRAWGLQVIDYERKPIRVAELKQRLGKYLGAAPSKA